MPRVSPVVLLVDDAFDVRAAFAAILVDEGFRVLEAADSHDAVARAITSPPDVIVLDVAVPGVDGVLLARVLRADPRTRAIPLIALTGRSLEGSDSDPFDQVLVKPCRPEALVHRIHAALDERDWPVATVERSRRRAAGHR
jgi:CheY-like chemotaxis protein